MTLAVFCLFAFMSVVLALLVVAQKNPMRSVLYLAFTILSVAGVFFTLQADFVGAVQIIVYAGGIVVLYVFVIIIINILDLRSERRKFFPMVFIIAVPLLLIAELVYVINAKMSFHEVEAGVAPGMEPLAKQLMTTYLVPFEIASVLLLAVLIGSIFIARKKVANDPD